jgi:glycerol uptake facilitator-like aquaporin
VHPPLPRTLLAEFLGSALLAAVVIGSGIAAQRLSSDAGLRLLENAAATGAGSPPRPRRSYIGAAYWFTSSTSFANPAITVGRMFSDTFAGIAPASVPGFVVAQVIGGAAAYGLVRALYPGLSPADAAEVIAAA